MVVVEALNNVIRYNVRQQWSVRSRVVIIIILTRGRAVVEKRTVEWHNICIIIELNMRIKTNHSSVYKQVCLDVIESPKTEILNQGNAAP